MATMTKAIVSFLMIVAGVSIVFLTGHIDIEPLSLDTVWMIIGFSLVGTAHSIIK